MVKMAPSRPVEELSSLLHKYCGYYTYIFFSTPQEIIMFKEPVILLFFIFNMHMPSVAMEIDVGAIFNKARYLFYVTSQHVNYIVESGGMFSFEKQFAKIDALKQQGKKVGLILGRAATEGLTKSDGRNFEVNENQAWAFLDLQAFYGEAPHFVMNITDISAWEKFPNELFSHLIFDWTAFDYALDDAAQKGIQVDVFRHLTRILEPSGILSFNARSQGDSMLALGTDYVMDSDKANVYPLRIETDLQREIDFLQRWNERLKEKKLSSQDLDEETLKCISYNEKDLIKLDELLKQRGVQAKADEEINVVTHVIRRLKSMGYQSVTFEESRPWCNYECYGFLIAVKRNGTVF